MMLEAASLVRLLGDIEYHDSVRGEHHHIVSLKHPMRAANELHPQKAIFRGVRVVDLLSNCIHP